MGGIRLGNEKCLCWASVSCESLSLYVHTVSVNKGPLALTSADPYYGTTNHRCVHLLRRRFGEVIPGSSFPVIIYDGRRRVGYRNRQQDKRIKWRSREQSLEDVFRL